MAVRLVFRSRKKGERERGEGKREGEGESCAKRVAGPKSIVNLMERGDDATY